MPIVGIISIITVSCSQRRAKLHLQCNITPVPYGQLNVIPVVFRCASGAAGGCGGDVAVGKAGLTNVSLARLGGAFAVLQRQTRTRVLMQLKCYEESFR